ncbi:uncharacterized protein LOC142566365 isoform X1 [Dermacentor variabilis]|uniref:uncharacterized protein LOC142566365 isoform X1 n=1 Tax=Dermacentor variabilis TaxID=34621 RepID=UPI003F5B0308
MEGEGHGIQERERFSQRTSRFVKRNASRVRFFSWKPHYPSGSLKAAAAAKVSYFIITSNEVNVYGHLDYYDAYLEVYAPSVTVGRRKAAAKVPKEVEKSSIDRETSLGEELACGESLFLLWLAHPKAGFPWIHSSCFAAANVACTTKPNQQQCNNSC